MEEYGETSLRRKIINEEKFQRLINGSKRTSEYVVLDSVQSRHTSDFDGRYGKKEDFFESVISGNRQAERYCDEADVNDAHIRALKLRLEQLKIQCSQIEAENEQLLQQRVSLEVKKRQQQRAKKKKRDNKENDVQLSRICNMFNKLQQSIEMYQQRPRSKNGKRI